jgi:hypothetical protein
MLRNLEATTHRGLQDRYWRLEAMRDKVAVLRAQLKKVNSTGFHEICKMLWDMECELNMLCGLYRQYANHYNQWLNGLCQQSYERVSAVNSLLQDPVFDNLGVSKKDVYRNNPVASSHTTGTSQHFVGQGHLYTDVVEPRGVPKTSLLNPTGPVSLAGSPLVTQHHQSQSYGQRSEQRPSTIDPALLQMRASTKNSQDRVRKDNVQRT